MWKRAGAIIASVIVSGVFLWLSLRDVPIAQVTDSIAHANIVWVVVTLGLGMAGIYARGVRWRGLVDDRVSVRHAFYIVGIMQFVNVLPLRMGEVARVVLATREDIPIVTTASSAVVERLLDLILVLAMLAVVAPRAQDIPPSVAQSITTFSVLAIIAFVVLLVLGRYPAFTRRLLLGIQQRVRLLQRFPLERLLDQMLDGLKPLTNRRRFIDAVIWTLIAWFCSWGTFYTGQVSLGISATALSFTTMCIALAAFAVAVPVTVAAVGPFQAAVIVAGVAFGVNDVLATALGFLIHGLTITSYIIAGTWGLLGIGVSLADITRRPASKPSEA
jgi:glycosyltransferase 2 family protein